MPDATQPPGRSTSWKEWSRRHRLLCGVLTAIFALLCALPISFMVFTASRTNFPGYSSTIFLGPLFILLVFGIGFLFFLTSLLLSIRK